MSKKWKPLTGNLVYSTHPEALPSETPEDTPELAPAEQFLKVLLDKKHRAGKIVTLIEGYKGSEEALETLSKKLKNHCGSGGSAKDGIIIIQGDHLEKIKKYLASLHYKVK